MDSFLRHKSHKGYIRFLRSLPFPRYLDILSWLIIANTCISINQWSRFPLGNQWTDWLIDYSLLFIVVWYIIKNRNLLFSREYKLCTFYLIWSCLGFFFFFLIASNYWEYKQLFTGLLMTSLPCYAYLFREPRINCSVLHKWNIVMPFLFLFFFIWVCSSSCYFFLFPFILLYGCFLPVVPGKWKLIVCVMLVAFCLDFSTRSNIIKVVSTIAVCFAYSCRRIIPELIYRIVHWLFYISIPVLLGLAATGRFNILEDMSSSNEGKHMTVVGDEEQDLSDDTRTFIYIEVIQSAIDNNYILFGNTPARGNYSESFVAGEYAMNEDLTGKGERHANELVHLNIFTWLGLVGLILYSIIYLQSSYYAVFRSNSVYMKLIGCTIAFHWVYGWIEDYNSFTVQNIWLWMMIGMGLSSKFRKMEDKQFKRWFIMLFKNYSPSKSHRNITIVPADK